MLLVTRSMPRAWRARAPTVLPGSRCNVKGGVNVLRCPQRQRSASTSNRQRQRSHAPRIASIPLRLIQHRRGAPSSRRRMRRGARRTRAVIAADRAARRRASAAATPDRAAFAIRLVSAFATISHGISGTRVRRCCGTPASSAPGWRSTPCLTAPYSKPTAPRKMEITR